jgi:hypothetical protein
LIGEYDEIELPPVQPFVRRHRRFAICCEHCRAKTPAPLPAVTVGTPFGQRIHALAIYLKTRQALSYERLQQACSDLFDLTINPAWLIWRGRCLWPGGERGSGSLPAQTLVRPRVRFRRRSCRHGAIDASRQEARTGTPDRRYPDGFDKLLNPQRTHRQDRSRQRSVARLLLIPRRSRADQQGSERALRPAVITYGYRAMWAAEYETAVRSAVDTARLAGAGSFQTILQTIVAPPTPFANGRG